MIRVGDRAPDFWLPNAEGRLAQFYDRFRGNRVVLVFLEALGARPDRRVSAAIEAVREHDAHVAFVVPQHNQGVKEAVAVADGAASVFEDPKGSIRQGYRSQSGGTVFVLDRDQRVLDVVDDPDAAVATLATIEDHDAPPTVIRAQAPVLILPRIFDPATCADLIAAWQADNYEGEVVRGSQMGGAGDDMVVDRATKRRRDHKPAPNRNHALMMLAGNRIAPEMKRVFQFSLVALQPFVVGRYGAEDEGGFVPHRDNTTKKTQNRRFAMSILLTDDYEGGELRFPEYGDVRYKPEAGAAVIFSCSLLHEVLPVTTGERFVALTFLFGPGDTR